MLQNVKLSMCLKATYSGPNSRQKRASSTNTARNVQTNLSPSGSTITKTSTREENTNVQDKAPPSSKTDTTTNDINVKKEAALSGKEFCVF